MTSFATAGSVIRVKPGGDLHLEATGQRTPLPSRLPPAAIFGWAFVGIGLLLGAWTFATPIGAAPDEPDHVVQGAAIVRGQFDEPTHLSPMGEIARVEVPAWAEGLGLAANCFAHLPQRPASCAGPLTRSSNLVSANTQFSNAPPLYYAIVGAPSLVFNGPRAVYAMRIAGDILNAALVALGLTLLIRFYPRRTPLVGALIALTPMTLFLMSVVNSSGLEISAAFATWCGAICLAEYPVVPGPLAIWTGVAAALLALSRPTSPLDVVIVAVTTVCLIGWRGLRGHGNSSLRWVLGPLIGALLIAAIVLVLAGPPKLLGIAVAHPAGLTSNAWAALRESRFVFRDAIGNFGWLDTPVSWPMVVAWVSCLAFLTAAAFLFSPACRRALVVLVPLIIAAMLVLETPHINGIGLWWQGRYSLPLLLGIPLVASTFTWPRRSRDSGRHRHRLTHRPNIDTIAVCTVGLVLSVIQVSAFELALRRYQTGLMVRPDTPVTWIPPDGRPFVITLLIGGLAVTMAFVVVMTRVPPPKLEADLLRSTV